MNLRDLAGTDLWALVVMKLTAWLLRLDLNVVEHLEKPPAAGFLWQNWKVDDLVSSLKNDPPGDPVLADGPEEDAVCTVPELFEGSPGRIAPELDCAGGEPEHRP